MTRLAGKVAVVSGGARGIGFAISQCLAREGARVIVADIEEAAAAAAAAEIASQGLVASGVALDVRDEKQWADLIDRIVSDAGSLDILVNNAGVAFIGTAEDTTLDMWRATHAINLEGVFLGTREAIRVMRPRGGSIVNISSIKAIVSASNSAAYDSSKGGVRSFTKSAALHCAEKRYGIRVNSVHPGYVHTPMLDLAFADDPDRDGLMAQITALHPIGRLGTPEDVANAVLFLVSDEASFITGSELVVDGGYTAQ